MKRTQTLLTIFLALIFTTGLMFASVELPKAVDRMLDQNIHFLDVATGQDVCPGGIKED